ncbi:acyl carrier protein [Chloroflexi bacterium TSY]|nr:acyl carrier protein [Chloroflexi bacterium TSY]
MTFMNSDAHHTPPEPNAIIGSGSEQDRSAIDSELTQGSMVNQERLIDTLAELPQSEWREQVADFLSTQLAHVLGSTNAEKISLRQRLFDLGLNSLKVVELQNRLENGLGVELTAALIFEYPTVEALLDSVDPNLAFLAIFSRDCRDFGVIYSDFGYRKQPISYLKIAQI